MEFLIDDIVTLIAEKVSKKADRSSFSMVCKQWCKAERLSRSSLSVQVDHSGFFPGAPTIFPNLVELEVKVSDPSSYTVSGNIGYVYRACPNLESLTIRDRSWSPQMNLLGLGNWCPKLSKLDLTGSFNCRVVELVQSLSNLKTLALAANEEIDDEDLREIGDASSISSLKLSFCLKITDAGLNYLANSRISETLRKLILNSSNKIRDYRLQVLRKMRSLEHLSLSEFSSTIADVGLKEISAVKTLKVLALGSFNGMSDTQMVAVAENCRDLETLGIAYGCNFVPGAFIRAFSGHKCLKCLVLIESNWWSERYMRFSKSNFDSIVLECPSLESVIVYRPTRYRHHVGERSVVKFSTKKSYMENIHTDADIDDTSDMLYNLFGSPFIK